MANLTACPACQSLAADGAPHCRTKRCTWNRCGHCATIYDRATGTSFNKATPPNGQ